MVNSSYGSKTNSLTLILQEKKKEEIKNRLCPARVSRDKQGKKEVLKDTINMLPPSEK